LTDSNLLEKVSGLCPVQQLCAESVQLGPVVGRRQQLGHEPDCSHCSL